MKGIKRISKNGKVYYYRYIKTGKPHTGRPIGTGKLIKVDYNRNRLLCLQRDNFTCLICGNKDNLDTHHKDNQGHNFAKYETNDNLDNLQTLCKKCHQRLHYGVLEKHQEITRRRKQGETFQSIANSYGVSRQRIQNIFSRNT